MKRLNKNVIVFICAFCFLIAGFFSRSIAANLVKDVGRLFIGISQGDENSFSSFTNSINNDSTKLLSYHNQLMDLNSIKDNLLGTKIIKKDGDTVIKTEYGSLIDNVKLVNLSDIESISERIDMLRNVAETNGANFLYCAAPKKEYYETTQERVDRYAEMMNILKTTNDPAKAASIFNEVFEVSGVAPVSRQNKAKKIYEELKGTDGTAITGSTYSGVSSSSSSSSSSSNSGSTKKSYPGIFNMLRSYLNNSRAGRVFNSLLGSSSSSNGPTYSTDSSSSSELSLDDTDTEEKEKDTKEKEKDTKEKESTKDSKNKEESSSKDIGEAASSADKAASDAAKKATSGSGKYIMPISRYGRGEELVPQIWKYLRGKGFTEASI